MNIMRFPKSCLKPAPSLSACSPLRMQRSSDQRKTLREGNTDLTASIALSEAEAGTALASVTDLMTTMDEKDRQLQNEMTNALNALVRSLPAGGQ